jgi:uncharacterized protein (DUF302 family)
MAYYFNKAVKGEFDQVLERVVASLRQEGFGILTEIDVRQTLRKKMEVEFRNYRILGACHPASAYQALLAEDKIGTMLPCNVIVQETGPGEIEVAAIDPIASMQAIDNPGLGQVAAAVREKLRQVVERI